MNNSAPNLEEVIAAIKTIYSPEDAAKLSFAYEGTKVEFEGEVWYEITTADGSGSYTAFVTVLEGEPVHYDGDRIAREDQIPEIEAILAKRD